MQLLLLLILETFGGDSASVFPRGRYAGRLFANLCLSDESTLIYRFRQHRIGQSLEQRVLSQGASDTQEKRNNLAGVTTRPS